MQAYNTQCPLQSKKLAIILKAAVGREKAVQAIDVHREWKNCVVTFGVMSQVFHSLGASRGCADFRVPTTVFRIIECRRGKGQSHFLMTMQHIPHCTYRISGHIHD